jgi:hypothetical protein
MIVMALMLTLGFGSYAYVDGEQQASGSDRQGESSFNLTEGVLSTQSYILSSNWPGSSAKAYPAKCAPEDGSAAANPDFCPQPAKVTESFASADYQSGAAWATTVRDDATGSYYEPSALAGAARWDANGNKQVWVRSDSKVGPRKRSLVALVQVERLPEVLPERVVIAGKFATGNAGNKIVVDAGGVGNAITVRCTPTGAPDDTCLDYEVDKGQISPPGAVATGAMVGEPALPPETVARLERRARSDGTYFPSGQCPSTLTGAVVFVENANCSYQGGGYNSATSPGIVIFRRGTLSLAGNFTFYGVVYMLNAQESTGDVFTVNGAGTLRGAVYADGDGGVEAGADKFNIVYDSSAVTNISSYGTAGVVQNTWRDVPSG